MRLFVARSYRSSCVGLFKICPAHLSALPAQDGTLRAHRYAHANFSEEKASYSASALG